MKKTRITAVAFVMVFALQLFITPVLAVADTNSRLSEDQEFLAPFYEKDANYDYMVKNDKGLDITSRFYNDTVGFYLQNDWKSIKEYKLQYVAEITQEYEIGLRGTDIAKTVTQELTQMMTTPTAPGRQMEVTCKLRGTFYYNPNTYVITQANNPIAVSITSADAFTEYSSIVLSRSISTYSVTFKVYFIVTRLGGIENYGTFNQSFTVSP